VTGQNQENTDILWQRGKNIPVEGIATETVELRRT